MKVIQVSGGNLFALAALYFGDASMWQWIAEVNGIVDPVLPATPMSLVIPDYDPTMTGGIPAQ